MFFDDLETDPEELDHNKALAEAAVDAMAEAYFDSPEGMRQQIVSLQQHNGLLIAQHERMELLIEEHKPRLPLQFRNTAREIGFYEPVSF